MSDELNNNENEHEKMDGMLPTTNESDLREMMSEIDKEQAYRQHTCWRQYITVVVSVLFCLFQLYATLTGRIPAQQLRATHLAFVQLLAFLLFPPTKKSPRNTLPWYDVVLGIIGAACWMYIVINFDSIAKRAGAYKPLDIVIGLIAILILFESCRRIVGIPILVIAAVFIVYALFGQFAPGFLNHRAIRPTRVVTHLFFTTEGIMGIPIGACSSFIFLFILFGALLEKTGIGQFFIDSCNAIAGGASGGPAKVAVLTSALLGTVSGSSVSNTVGSGSFTIPMMKRLGYKGEFAGAVEAAASTGGQLMPPIMGAAAFLMAESLGLPYITIVKAAIIPAILYFTGIFMTVHLEAHKLGLKGLPREELPKFLPLILKQGYMMLPLVVIVFFLCTGKTAVYAALMGILACLLIGLATSVVDIIQGRTPKFGMKDVIEVMTAAARNIISVAIACAMAGIIIGIVTLTGIGLKFGAGLISISHGIAFITLALTMISSIILGMGAPTTANYLITSTITAGAIIGLGFQPLAAIAGAAIAKAKPIKTAINATKLAIGAFIIPYVFVYNPQMLMIDTTFLGALPICVTALIGMFCISAALEGYCFRKESIVERVVFAAAGIMCILPNHTTDFIGIGVMALLIAFQLVMRKRDALGIVGA